MSDVSDEVLKQIAEGVGRTYNHEGKAMAKEIIRWRAAAKEAAAKAAASAAAPVNVGQPFPFHP